MAAVPTSFDWTDGVVFTAAQGDAGIRDVTNYLLARPIAQARQTVAQSLTTAVFAAVTFTTEDVDSDGMHSTVSNTSRFTAVHPGWYRCSGAVGFAASAAGRRLTKWQVNGADINGSALYLPPTAASVQKMSANTILVFLNVGDFVELLAAQESGGSINTAVGALDQSTATVVWESN